MDYALEHNPELTTETGMQATPSSTRKPTRQRMIESAVQLLRERGAAGVTVDAVLALSGAPRGSVYHHFPRGRIQILEEATGFAGDAITGVIESASKMGSHHVLAKLQTMWTHFLTQSNFATGCPAVSVVVGGSPDDDALQPLARDIFIRWQDAIMSAMIKDGMAPERAARLASVALSTIEGAVILCRVHESVAPLDDAIAALEELIGQP